MGMWLYPDFRRESVSQNRLANSDYGPVLGIDLGHAYTRVAVVRDSGPEVIVDSRNVSDIPTWGGRWAFNGRQKGNFPIRARCGSFLCSFTSGVVRWFDRPSDSNYSPDVYWDQPEIVETFRNIRLVASRYLSEPVTHAVLAVPSTTSDDSRDTLKELAQLAGLTLLRVVNAPVAVGRAYGLDADPGEGIDELVYVVVDVGANELKVDIVRVDDGVFELLGSVVESSLGGDAYNSRILRWLRPGELTESSQEGRLYLEETERIKCLASTPCTLDGPRADDDCELKNNFESITRNLVDSSVEALDRALSESNVIITGGSGNLLQLRTTLESHLGKIAMIPKNGDRIENAAAIGAAIHGRILSHPDPDQMCQLRSWAASVGIETSGGLYEPIISHSWGLPDHGFRTFTVPEGGVTDVRVHVGSRKLVRDNLFLGEMHLPVLEPGLDITVKLNWERDGSINVVVDSSTGAIAQAVVATADDPRLNHDVMERLYRDGTDANKEGTQEALDKLAMLKIYVKELWNSTQLAANKETQEAVSIVRLERLSEMIEEANDPCQNDVDLWLGQVQAMEVKGLDRLPVRSP
ncbi:heat shock protein HSP70 family protein [Ceratobasidium sp. AG-Ba]|nr:heat shock protein HSP70 family protein [Ceratobasidium sp. AG-Ba]QRW07750.1 heat shock protein HSP70 family protein [Ceratobasidium sp. AG-Ba]